jgi:DNA-binding SARP family transcriptional activator
MGRAMVAARERGDLEPARSLRWPSVEVTRGLLPPRYAAELALYASAAGATPPAALLVEPRRAVLQALDRVASIRPELRAHIARVRVTLPHRRPYALTVDVLGEVRLRRDDAALSAPELRRERVRALLVLLAIRRRIGRDRAAAILWPDMDDATAGRNLRVTLTHLQRALEPDRAADDDVPYFVRSEHSELVLADDVVTDLSRFERAVDEALDAERRYAGLDALEHYELAIACYGGEVGGGATWHWLHDLRERVRQRFVAAATRAAELQLARGEPERALAHARAAIAADATAERAYLIAADATLGTGDRDGARRFVDRARALVDDLGVSASPDLQALERRLAAS